MLRIYYSLLLKGLIFEPEDREKLLENNLENYHVIKSRPNSKLFELRQTQNNKSCKETNLYQNFLDVELYRGFC